MIVMNIMGHRQGGLDLQTGLSRQLDQPHQQWRNYRSEFGAPCTNIHVEPSIPS